MINDKMYVPADLKERKSSANEWIEIKPDNLV